MKILYVSPELTPFTHGGSLGTIMGDLATAAIQAGHEVTAIAPFRAETSPQRFGLARRLDTITVRGARPAIECVLYEGSLRGRDGALRLLEHEASFGHGDQATARQDDHHSAYALAQATLQ
ncbi:MAG: glycogen/starch synthase, partial [Deltaproteobacteria bacterium]|nr:glycogen/starch synthase [Deltaproteobacteria bacterium]